MNPKSPAPLIAALAAIGGLVLVALSVVLDDTRTPVPTATAPAPGAAGADGAAHDHASHDHSALLVLQPGPTAPTLDFDLVPDSMAGVNLHIRTTNFRFAPENVNADHRPGEGHAHVYVNGEKRARLYGPWYHLSPLPKGEVAVRVTLNANSHDPLAVGDKPLDLTKVLRID